ncbi:MAG TPA: hypothetical protein VHP58_02410 [Alphaproteobacteria bacterium]|nr:hypothetical protein [Alphaproteobacteria bacterium]
MKNTNNLWFLVPLAAAAGVALVALSACTSPKAIQNDYTFTPPADEQGQMCVANCATTHATCVQTCETRKYKCNKFESKAVRGDVIVKAGDDPACEVVVCENKCAETLSGCYTSCGGTVTKNTTVTKVDPTKPLSEQ